MRSKGDVGYDDQGGSSHRSCDGCVSFIETDGCRTVSGEINSDGICDMFDRDTYKTASPFFKGGKFEYRDLTPGQKRMFNVAYKDNQSLLRVYKTNTMNELDLTETIMTYEEATGIDVSDSSPLARLPLSTRKTAAEIIITSLMEKLSGISSSIVVQDNDATDEGSAEEDPALKGSKKKKQGIFTQQVGPKYSLTRE